MIPNDDQWSRRLKQEKRGLIRWVMGRGERWQTTKTLLTRVSDKRYWQGYVWQNPGVKTDETEEFTDKNKNADDLGDKIDDGMMIIKLIIFWKWC